MPPRKSARPAIDFLILAAILVVANLVLNSGDRGWLFKNPSPFLLLPLLIGGKYGLRAGLSAGGGAMVITLLLACSGGTAPMDVLKSAPLLFLALPTVGLISGELQRQVAGRREELEEENERLRLSENVFANELEVARESQQQLQTELLLQGADVCSLDVELRKIFEPGAPPVLKGTLDALAEVSGITSAAFYLLDARGDRLVRDEGVGEGSFFPDVIEKPQDEMVWAAVDADELVTCRGLGEGKAEIGTAKYLAALPWRSGGKVMGVLLIHDMPFLSMNWQMLARIELVCDWVGALNDARAEPALEKSGAAPILELVGRSASAHGLPTAVALVIAAGAASAGELRDALASALRPADVALESVGGLAVVLPLESGRDADATVAEFSEVLGAAGQDARIELVTIDGSTDADAMWEKISSSAKT